LIKCAKVKDKLHGFSQESKHSKEVAASKVHAQTWHLKRKH